jgi:hypothetical protein
VQSGHEPDCDRYERIRRGGLQQSKRLCAHSRSRPGGPFSAGLEQADPPRDRGNLAGIPRLDWENLADLFRPEGEFAGPVDSDAFAVIADQADRKFAALCAAAKTPLITNDNHVLAQRNLIGIDVLTPRGFLARERADC